MESFDLNGIVKVKREISKAIDMDVCFITECFVDGDDVVFTVLMDEQFVGEWKNNTVTHGSIQHLKSHTPIEEAWF